MIRRMFDCPDLHPLLMAEANRHLITDATHFNLVIKNVRATVRVVNGLRKIAKGIFPGAHRSRAAHKAQSTDMRSTFVRVGSKPAEPEVLTQAQHDEAFRAGAAAAKLVREREEKEAADAADRELARQQRSAAAKARWRARKAREGGSGLGEGDGEEEEQGDEEEQGGEEDVAV